MSRINGISQGQTILIIGVLRYFNNEIYISPEISRNIQPEYLLVRKLEIEKEKTKNSPPIQREKIIAVKDNLLNSIKDAEINQGINIDELIMKIRDASPDIINQEIKKMIEEGIIFEPRPGRVRYLGWLSIFNL